MICIKAFFIIKTLEQNLLKIIKLFGKSYTKELLNIIVTNFNQKMFS